jgi:hypothetical protein
MRSPLSTLRRLKAARRQRLLEGRTGDGVYTRRIVVDLSRGENGYLVGLTYVLGVHGPQSNVPVILDLRHCPFLLFDTSSNAALKPTQLEDHLELVLAPGCDWEGARIYTSFEWHTEGATGSTPLLSLPDVLPSLLRRASSGELAQPLQQPIIDIGGSAAVTNSLVGGIPVAGHDAANLKESSLIQAVLGGADTLIPQARCLLVRSGSLVVFLRP